MPERDLSAERKAALHKILADAAPLKVIVAGPGTGKTYAFKQLLGGDRKDNLVLTFINLLVKDLTTELGDMAFVETLHRYAVGVLHRQGTPGLSNQFKLYPHLGQMLEPEIELLLGRAVTKAAIERAMQWLEQDESIDAFLRAGNYYDTVGFVDVVYRVVQRFIGDPHTITQFKQVLVDEVQDSTKLEVELINQLASQSPVVAVGDDDQAIYGDRHASPEFIRSMAGGGIWKHFELPFCSRCTPVIVAAVHDVLDKAKAEGQLKECDSVQSFALQVWRLAEDETNRSEPPLLIIAKRLGPDKIISGRGIDMKNSGSHCADIESGGAGFQPPVKELNPAGRSLPWIAGPHLQVHFAEVRASCRHHKSARTYLNLRKLCRRTWSRRNSVVVAEQRELTFRGEVLFVDKCCHLFPRSLVRYRNHVKRSIVDSIEFVLVEVTKVVTLDVLLCDPHA